ncbi:aminotransferase class V-fold PLP-dependent enzyme [Pleomorphovibrio marinus]|uniref:aminotransferase class V-fold PLP-dependent enzyme n=1 Tax=Pleomorphovibrio marinus TaxID=2164132 RepID=UPI000E0A3896|nr:aminotransferase class V-fold PLP-dependent enzyme [Pleomorphovibrio marinus]
MDRRKVIKNLALLPMGGSFISLSKAEGKEPIGPISLDKDIYESIGVETIINCRGTFTIIGGSRERPEVLDAMKAAAGNFIQYDEMAHGIGRRLAEITQAEWGIVTAGCAAAMKHATAACISGGNPEILLRIPDLSGLQKTEVIIPRYARNVYDAAIRNIGVTIVEVSTAEELEAAINPKTAMIYLMTNRHSLPGQPFSLEVIASIANPKKIPILVDAAAENLSIPNIHLQQGATMVAYSGGKAICGPQCAGILLGKKDILLSAWQASSPHHGPGRDNKVGKEEMMGMLAAVEAWVTRNHDEEWKTWESWLDQIGAQVRKIKGISTEIQLPTDLNNRAPVLQIMWDPNQLSITGPELAEYLGRNKPRLAVGGRDNGEEVTMITINPSQMIAPEVTIVAERLHEVLKKKRSPKNPMKAPIGTLAGRWQVDIEFFSSTSTHKWFLEQDENWLLGRHESDFSSQDILGTIEGKEVKLHSTYREPGKQVQYMFNGSLEGDTISGNIHLGEYQTAVFTAKRLDFSPKRKPILIPDGPPLAT